MSANYTDRGSNSLLSNSYRVFKCKYCTTFWDQTARSDIEFPLLFWFALIVVALIERRLYVRVYLRRIHVVIF